MKSWYSRDNLLHDTLNPQNIFIKKHKNTKENNFIKDDPYVDKVLKNKIIFYDEFIKSFEKHLKMNSENDERINDKYKKNTYIEVFNITPSLMEIFKHFYSFSHFEENLTNALNGFNLDPFRKRKNFKLFTHYVYYIK